MELNKENLYNEYIIKNLSRTECSKVFDCSDSLIQKRLKIYGIKKDRKAINETKKRIALNNSKYNIPKEDLYREYIINNLTTYECSKYFNCKETLIEKRLRDYNIKKDKKKIYENTAKTMLQKYGVDNSSKLDSALQKRQETNIRKYGAKTYAESNCFKERTLENNPNYGIISSKELLKSKILEMGKPTLSEICKELNYSYTPVFKAIQKFDLGSYIKKEYSKTNIYWHDLILKELGIDMEYEGCIFDNNYEKVDLYYSEKKIAIDINPTITHNTQFNPFHPENITYVTTTYHFNRAVNAEKNGWLLYQIFDWDSQDKVLLQLKNLFGLNDKIYARKCIVKEVGKYDAKEFLEKYHIQGYIGSKYRYGLYHNDILVSLMTFGKSRFYKDAEIELLRYCSIGTVVGGASKLFNYAVSQINPKNIVTYSDMGKGHGNVYTKLGFKFMKYAGLNALYAPIYHTGIAYKTQKASQEYQKNGKEFKSCKEYFNSKKWYRINDAGNKIWVWTNPNYNSEN